MTENALIERIKGLETLALDEDVIGEIDEVLAGCPVHRPLLRHMFVWLQYLLNDDVQWPV